MLGDAKDAGVFGKGGLASDCGDEEATGSGTNLPLKTTFSLILSFVLPSENKRVEEDRSDAEERERWPWLRSWVSSSLVGYSSCLKG